MLVTLVGAVLAALATVGALGAAVAVLLAADSR